MIGFNNLGNLGRLGNQMFQFAALKGIATNRGFEYCIPSKNKFGTTDSLVRNSDITIHDCFELDQNIGSVNGEIRKESFFHFDENLFNNCEDGVNLYGYFQSEKYFKNIKDQIKKDFSFKEEVFVPSSELFKQAFGNTEVISLHIRRGDYVNSQEHPAPSIEYYSKCLEKLNMELPVMIFSDDIEWCKKQNIFSEERFIFSEKNGTDVDLCLQTLCSHHIIANSSFSWWGACLSNSKNVLVPEKWFGGRCSSNLTKDLFLEEWQIINF